MLRSWRNIVGWLGIDTANDHQYPYWVALKWPWFRRRVQVGTTHDTDTVLIIYCVMNIVQIFRWLFTWKLLNCHAGCKEFVVNFFLETELHLGINVFFIFVMSIKKEKSRWPDDWARLETYLMQATFLDTILTLFPASLCSEIVQTTIYSAIRKRKCL